MSAAAFFPPFHPHRIGWLDRGNARTAVARRRCSFLLSLLILCSAPVVAQSFAVDGSGNVEATSFAGDGSSLTDVGANLFHGFVNGDCAAGQTCFYFVDCPTGMEVTGGGFFINSGVLPDRQAVVLHQTYRLTGTQWAAEATNGSASTLDLFVTSECARVAPTTAHPETLDPFAAQGPLAGQDLPPALDPNVTLLACPEWDVARYVDRKDAGADHYCPNHGLRMRASGGGPLPIPLLPAANTAESTEAEK